MEKEGENIPLSGEDKLKIKRILFEKNFEDFKIHKHYFRDKFSDVFIKIPRHGIELSELKGIFNKKHQIEKAFKRKTNKGYLYTLCYKESETVFVKIGYLFNKDPLEIFQAIRIFRRLDNAVKNEFIFQLDSP